jgi:hypothetical protein
MIFPSIGEYNQTIISRNGKCLNQLHEAVLIPVRTTPIKVFAFGSGANAVVFKANYHNRTYGIRCFLNNDLNRVDRARSISKYLENINASWKIDYKFLDNEMVINGASYPIIQMTWSTGKDLNSWTSDNLNENEKLNQLQKKIVELSKSLEENNIGHGDIQCGNILVEETGSIITLKLIDYDGVYIPTLSHLNAIENGRGEFQHPSRNLLNYRPTIDRFSFIVIVTALELLKFDKSLWKSPLQYGFNTLDNLLFSASDFKNPNSSKLFTLAKNLNIDSVNFYLDQLLNAINCDISQITELKLYHSGNNRQEAPIIFREAKTEVLPGILILESNVKAFVYSGLKSIGQTPLKLDKNTFVNKELNVLDGKGGVKKIIVTNSDDILRFTF